MNSKSVIVEPILNREEYGEPCCYVNRELISTTKMDRLALEILTVIDKEDISYGAAEIALDRAKELLDNMKISGLDNIKRYFDKSFDVCAELEKVLNEK